MIIVRVFIPKRIRYGKGFAVHVYKRLIVSCDWCKKEFLISRCIKYVLSRTHHHCCKEHQRLSQCKGGPLDRHKKQLFQQKFGVDTPLQLKEVHEKAIMLANSPIARQKAMKTSMKNWGVPFPMQHPEHVAKCNKPESIAKCNETKRRNGSMRESVPERLLRQLLQEQFGVDNITSHIRLHRCSIDMHIKPINTYVQFDGVYWHGLDRPYSLLKEEAKFSERSRVILDKYDRDRMLDDYCASHGIRLVRVTDVEFYIDSQKALKKITGVM